MENYTEIAGTPVFVFERHSDAIIPWAKTRRQYSDPLTLVTFDKHTDTLEPFLRWSYWKADRLNEHEKQFAFRDERMRALNFYSDETVLDAAKDLWHDEHIQAAMGAKIIGKAYVVSLDSFSKRQQVDGIHYLPSICHYGCTKVPHDDDCVRAHSDLAIDDIHLEPSFNEHHEFRAMLKSCEPIILDIDLDYFRTSNALSPSSTSVLASLVARAVCITIALESAFVEDGRLDDEVNSEWALRTLIPILKIGEQDSAG